MNYQAHYDKLVARAQLRIYHPDVYVEKHHIIPRCMGGSDHKSNIVKLLPEEHLFAHRLLCRIYPQHHGLASAVMQLAGVQYGRSSRRLYAADRERYANSRRHFKVSDETRARQREATTILWASEDYKTKTRLAHLEAMRCPEARQKIANASNRAWSSAEYRAKMSERSKKPKSEETKRRMSEARALYWAKRKAQEALTN